MIAKITAPAHCQSAIDYISAANRTDKKATLLLHSVGILATDNGVMAACLEAATLKGDHSLKSPIKHISLNFHPKDAPRMTDEFMCQLAQEYMAEMGIKDTEFVIYRHHDKRHPHCHLIFSRVNRQGKVISDSREKERNTRVCKHLTMKYGLHLSEGKISPNKNRLQGTTKLRYEMLDKVMTAKEKSNDWKEFDNELKERGISLKFHYNNVSRKLMGVSFSDGQHSYSGKQLDKSLTYSVLAQSFGNINELAHDNAKEHYEARRERLLELNAEYYHPNILKAFPKWDAWFDKGLVTPNAFSLLSSQRNNMRQFSDYNPDEYMASTDHKSCFIPLGLMVAVALAPFSAPIEQSSGGGGSDNGRGWRNDDEDERWKFRFNYQLGRQHSTKRTLKR